MKTNNKKPTPKELYELDEEDHIIERYVTGGGTYFGSYCFITDEYRRVFACNSLEEIDEKTIEQTIKKDEKEWLKHFEGLAEVFSENLRPATKDREVRLTEPEKTEANLVGGLSREDYFSKIWMKNKIAKMIIARHPYDKRDIYQVPNAYSVDATVVREFELNLPQDGPYRIEEVHTGMILKGHVHLHRLRLPDYG